MTGLIHIYCGDGKGKTTAALGMAIRAAGHQRKILIVRFLKNDNSGEVEVLRKIPGIVLLPCDKTFGFVSQMAESEKREAICHYKNLFEKMKKMVVDVGFDLLIMDEIIAACNHMMIQESTLLTFLQQKPKKLEIIMTGRNPSEKLLDLADYVSEIKACKHPYQNGIGAREGIEY